MPNEARTAIPLDDDELRQVTRYAALCARQVLPVFEAARPADRRPREAVAEAEAFAGGGRRVASLRASAWAALAAAREAGDGPAAHAAHAASLAAAAAYLHPVASPHQVKHILGAAVHLALVYELEAGNRPEVGGEKLHWAADLAPATVRDVLRRFPPPLPGRGRFATLLAALDTDLREESDPTPSSPA